MNSANFADLEFQEIRYLAYAPCATKEYATSLHITGETSTLRFDPTEHKGETVIHHVELSLFPNWVGVDQERLVEVMENRLTLSTRPILLGGIQQSAHLI